MEPTNTELKSKLRHSEMQVEELREAVQEYKKMYEHTVKVISIRDKSIKELKDKMASLTITSQTFKDKVEELLNVIDDMKETA